MVECQVCGTNFEIRGRDQKYCSAKCKQAAYRDRLRAGRAVPEEAASELESLRRSRDYYRRKVENLEFERDMAVLDSQMMKPFNWVTNQPVIEPLSADEEDELSRLKRYVRERERTEWRRPFCGLRGPGPAVPMGAKPAAEFTRELYEDVSVLRVKLNTASAVRAWEDLGYPDEDSWWWSVLNAAENDAAWSRVEDPDDADPEWMGVPISAQIPERPGEPPEVG